MDFNFYEILLNLEGLLILSLSFYFIVFFLNHLKSSYILNDDLNIPKYNSLNLKKIGIIFVSVLLLSMAILYNSWWPHHHFLFIALVFLMATAFIHDSFLVSSFILLLFIRPWELLEAKYLNQFPSAEIQTLFNPSEMVSIPKLWLFLLIGNFIFGLSIKQNYRRLWNKLDVLVMAFVLWMLFPILIQGKTEDLQKYIDTLFSGGVIYFFVRWNLRDNFSYKALSRTLSLIGVFLLATAFLQFYLGNSSSTSTQRAEAFGLFENSNDLAALIVLCLPFILIEIHSIVLIILVSIIAFYGIYITQSRGAFIGALISLGVFVYFRYKIKNISVKKIISIAVIFGLLFKLFVSYLNREQSDMHDSSWGRLNFWIAAVRMAIYNPISGVGFGNYPKNFERYALEFLEYGERTAHSSFFLVLAEGGILGAVIYFFIFKSAFSSIFKIKSYKPELAASFSGYFLTMLFLSHCYLFFIFVLLALVNSIYLNNFDSFQKNGVDKNVSL